MSDDQEKEKQIKAIYLECFARLKKSCILDDVPHKGNIRDNQLFGKRHSLIYICKNFASLHWHQKHRRQISANLRKYLETLQRELSSLEKIRTLPVQNLKAKVHLCIRIVQELIPKYSLSKKDYLKDLVYWNIFKLFRYAWRLKYDETLGILTKLTILFEESTATCQQISIRDNKRCWLYSPTYAANGRFIVQKSKVSVTGRKVKKCRRWDDNKRKCWNDDYCTKEETNTDQRLTRLRKVYRLNRSHKNDALESVLHQKIVDADPRYSSLDILKTALDKIDINQSQWEDLKADPIFMSAVAPEHTPL